MTGDRIGDAQQGDRGQIQQHLRGRPTPRPMARRFRPAGTATRYFRTWTARAIHARVAMITPAIRAWVKRSRPSAQSRAAPMMRSATTRGARVPLECAFFPKSNEVPIRDWRHTVVSVRARDSRVRTERGRFGVGVLRQNQVQLSVFDGLEGRVITSRHRNSPGASRADHVGVLRRLWMCVETA